MLGAPRRGGSMQEAFVREIALIGEENFEKLWRARVAVFGIGGVGSFAAEALVRAGIGALTFVDGDVVAQSNRNRQLIALQSTQGRNKARVMCERAQDISPQCRAEAAEIFYGEDTAAQFDFTQFDCVADCIDSVPAKVHLLCAARAAGTAVVSCMGAGNKLDGTAFRVADLEQTRECPLARILRREMKKAGVTGVRAVYSEEKPTAPTGFADGSRQIGSISFVPSAAGLLVAAEVVRLLLRAN